MQSQTETSVQRKSSNTASRSTGGARSEASESRSSESGAQHEKSVKEIIGSNLDKDTQKQIDDVVKQASQYISTGKTYVSENRGEALFLAAAFGVAAWALLYTKPGRQILELAAPKIIPQISNLVSETLGSSTAKA